MPYDCLRIKYTTINYIFQNPDRLISEMDSLDSVSPESN